MDAGRAKVAALEGTAHQRESLSRFAVFV
jgi:hypothetical protein